MDALMLLILFSPLIIMTIGLTIAMVCEARRTAETPKAKVKQKCCNTNKSCSKRETWHHTGVSRSSNDTPATTDGDNVNDLVLGTILGSVLDDDRPNPEPVHIHIQSGGEPAEAYQPDADHGYSYASSHDSYSGGSDCGSSDSGGGCDGGGCGD